MSTAVHAAARHAASHLRDTFIPHEGNGHKPHAVSHRALLLYSALLILTKGLLLVGAVALPSSSLYSSSITAGNIVTLTNAARTSLSLPTLTRSDVLDRAAQAKAEDMLANGYFAHTSPAGVTPWDWFKQVGYGYTYAGENLAVHYATAEDVGEGWMASPSHRANIVNPSYSEIGVGVAYGTFEGVPSHIVVQMFGTPLPVPAQAAPQQQVAVAPVPVPQPVPPTPEPTGEVAAAAVQIEPAPVAVQRAPVPADDLPQTTAPAADPIVDQSSLRLQQRGDSYELTVEVEQAADVQAQIGGQRVELTRLGKTDTWTGSVPFSRDTASVGGEQLSITASGYSGSTVSQVLAWVAPAAQTQNLYNFNGGQQRAIKLLGLTVDNLNDSTRQVYLYFAVFLGVAMLLNVAIKFRVQHPTIIGHGAAVMALAVILFLV